MSYDDMKVSELKKVLSERNLKTSGNKKSLIERLEEYDSVPNKVVDKDLYIKAKETVKKRVKVWPSAYASGQLQTEYKRMGGKYKGEKEGKLDRWYREKWVNVCKPKKGGYEPCGRSESKPKDYPYCRPSKRVNSKTPKTVGEFKKSELEKMCEKKRKQGKPKSKKGIKGDLCPSSFVRNGRSFVLSKETKKTCQYKNEPKSPKRVYH